jgi:hypothetical protein
MFLLNTGHHDPLGIEKLLIKNSDMSVVIFEQFNTIHLLEGQARRFHQFVSLRCRSVLWAYYSAV